LHGGTVLAEFVRLLPHHRLIFSHTGRLAPETAAHFPALWVFAYLLAFVLTLFGVVYFVRSIAVRHREAENLSREREQIAISRERLARIGEISAGVAHAVRNPLHGILNCVDLLRRRVPADDGAQDILKLMSEGLRRIDTVTHRLLLLSREPSLQKTRASINDLIEETVRFVEVKAHRKTVPIRLELSQVPEMQVDTTRLCEALFNVMHNAIDACDNGAGVTVVTSEMTSPLPGVKIEVIDTGTGIPADVLPKVFEPFFTTKPVGEGTGLGLAMTLRIVEEHGGTVSVKSQVGKGTHVTFLLPVG
jgi:signal transduction histidine kinase